MTAMIQIKASSAGHGAGNSAEIRIDNVPVEFPGGVGRGLNVVAIDAVSGRTIWINKFDTNSSAKAADEFAALVEALPIGQLVAIAVKDDAQGSLTDRARRACQLLGSSRIWDLEYRNSWSMVGQRGSAPGSASENLSGRSSVEVNAEVIFKDSERATIRIFAQSSISHAEVWWNDELRISGRSGLNVVFADNMGKFVLATSYDTVNDPDASGRFADLVDSLERGSLVAIATQGAWASKLTDKARAACRSLGSRFIDQVDVRERWSIVGFAGALRGSVAECWSPGNFDNIPVRSTYWHTPGEPNATSGFSLAVSSAGYGVGDSAAIAMSGLNATDIAPNFRYGRGLNVVVFDEISGVPLSARCYDTHATKAEADAFAELIEVLPVGRVVAIAVKDEATMELTERAKRACGLIGSALIRNLANRGSWALIGRKGSTPGSVPEDVGNDRPVSIETWFADDRARPARPFNEIRVRSAGYKFGDSALINVTFNPNQVAFPIGYQRGLNVAVLEQRTGAVLQAETFVTHASTQASDAFADLVEGLPRGQVVAVAVKDEAIENLNLRGWQALYALGSTAGQFLKYRGSMAFVGYKGGVMERTAEGISNDSATTCVYWLTPRDYYASPGFTISGRSAGLRWGNFSWLAVGPQVVVPEGAYRRGLNVIVLDQRDGAVLVARNFDTNYSDQASNDFAELIEGSPPGRVVALAAQDDAQNHLTERAKRACESLGSAVVRNLAYRGSWVLIGLKGTAPGSALERLDNDGPVGVSLYVPPQSEPSAEPEAGGDVETGADAETGPDAETGADASTALLAPDAATLFGIPMLKYLARNTGVLPIPTPVPESRKYNEATWLVAHNAFANRADGWQWWDSQQNLSITGQLLLGVRGLALDVFVYTPVLQSEPGLYLCHGACWHAPTLRTLTQVLTEVVAFLKANPKEIVTIFIESPSGWLPDEESNLLFLESFKASGAFDLIFWPDRTDATPKGVEVWHVNTTFDTFNWPTTGAMIAKDKRLVMFVDRNTGTPEDLHHIVPFVWRYVHESEFSDQNDLAPCEEGCPEREQSAKQLQKKRTVFLWNHFPEYATFASLSYINSYDRLLTRAKVCGAAMKLVPNFAEIDFVDIGQGLRLANRINRFVWSAGTPSAALAALEALKSSPPAEEL